MMVSRTYFIALLMYAGHIQIACLVQAFLLHKEIRLQTQRLIVSTHDRRFFIEKVQQLTLLGAKLADNTVPRLTTPFPFQAEFDITLDSPKDIFKSELGIHALCPSAEIFTEEEMKAMTFEDFREQCGWWGIKGRERETMLTEYLKATKQK